MNRTVYLWITVTIWLLIWSLAHLTGHPSFLPFNKGLYADSFEDNSLCYTPELRTRTASLIYQNFPSRLKHLLEWKREPCLVSMETSFVALGSSFAGVRRLPFRPALHHEYCTLPCSLGIIQLGYHFLCRLLTGYRLSAAQWRFLEWTSIVSFVTDSNDSKSVHCTVSNWGLEIILPRKQLHKQCSAAVLIIQLKDIYIYIYIYIYENTITDHMVENSPHYDLYQITAIRNKRKVGAQQWTEQNRSSSAQLCTISLVIIISLGDTSNSCTNCRNLSSSTVFLHEAAYSWENMVLATRTNVCGALEKS
jgi:hypothetical protein